ncbi:hypothetical protein NSK_004587 [Nannochloropsis salina CCMP1776]|uniref:Small ribosomal subunit protein uS17 N-terminal domain-containing protein n=1 Tax=Nannochloropsis salina CCMP1776 TaxID=1027361 RepID=A0A4D9CZU0_9STRA|nr:hypothetical protein NSK_004587 [Nannochloropsis salina CCMP1776]|eukprot:TFJ84114.1 hypothetical protein NSK_004587 [Nannochloropsis salina CCMP1776]
MVAEKASKRGGYREADQHEKAYQVQNGVFMFGKSSSRKEGSKRSKHGARWTREVGLGFKTPKEAKAGTYVDKKCPFTGSVSIRGRILKGIVLSTKMNRTVIIRRDYLHWVSKYSRFEKRHKNLAAHCSPAFPQVKEGDIVTVGQCRPLSKTVRFNVLQHEPSINQALSIKKQFRVF